MKKAEDYPEIVYKYRNWKDDFHKDILLKNNFFMASPEYFNDPFDCKIPINYRLLHTPDKIERFAISFVDRNKQFFLSCNQISLYL